MLKSLVGKCHDAASTPIIISQAMSACLFFQYFPAKCKLLLVNEDGYGFTKQECDASDYKQVSEVCRRFAQANMALFKAEHDDNESMGKLRIELKRQKEMHEWAGREKRLLKEASRKVSIALLIKFSPTLNLPLSHAILVPSILLGRLRSIPHKTANCTKFHLVCCL